ncbi:hypothetical protein KIN20_002015 [Parelaphostrongylus tenuis]|uniref:Uncharacterized protein n=1 Tax=Parelaphostrongylus tenuis TaxID=148309 RepID=A0AAD5MDK3_PARTN|nr:hypothetical protein KIN20_002015 [Parelaphostrongylus tenuis]
MDDLGVQKEIKSQGESLNKRINTSCQQKDAVNRERGFLELVSFSDLLTLDVDQKFEIIFLIKKQPLDKPQIMVGICGRMDYDRSETDHTGNIMPDVQEICVLEAKVDENSYEID